MVNKLFVRRPRSDEDVELEGVDEGLERQHRAPRIKAQRNVVVQPVALNAVQG